jgi:maltooligosyltrehalose trehalohydrolase
MRYRLQRDDRWPQADPASQFQPDGVFGPSEIIDHRCYRWQNESWRGLSLEDVVLYELHVGTFSHTRDYDGVRRRLSHLRDCGITAIKLMPLATFAGRQNWGYDGVFHMAPFAAYGRPDQLRRLIDEAHGHGIAVLLDVVSNHFGPEGNPMWDMARPFFCERGNTAWGPGPRFERATVMAYFDEMARLFRREYRFDGLRVDAVDAIPIEHRKQHIVQLRDAIEDSGPKDGHSILMLELFDSQHDVLRHRAPGCSVTQLNTEFQRAGHRLLTGEGHNEYSDFVAPDRDFQSCLADGFAFFDRKSDFIGKVVGQPLDALPWPTIVNYLVNHDTCGNRYLGQRLQALIGDRAFRAAHALLILQPGMPYLFMGQEWATKGRYHFFTDFEQGLGRRVARGRKRGFHELGAGGIDGCEQKAPAPQQRQALESSTLDWSELEQSPHREMASPLET